MCRRCKPDHSRDRGQTAQDFAVGISIFLLAIAFVFVFAPSLLTPYESTVGGDTIAKADRAAATIIHDASVDGGVNELDGGSLEWYMEQNTSVLQSSLALHSVDRINVTVQHVNGTVWQQSGQRFGEAQPRASASRIVTVEGGEFNCDPACRVVVRVW